MFNHFLRKTSLACLFFFQLINNGSKRKKVYISDLFASYHLIILTRSSKKQRTYIYLYYFLNNRSFFNGQFYDTFGALSSFWTLAERLLLNVLCVKQGWRGLVIKWSRLEKHWCVLFACKQQLALCLFFLSSSTSSIQVRCV